MFISTSTPRFALRPLVIHLLAVGGLSILACIPSAASAQPSAQQNEVQQTSRQQNNIHQNHKNSNHQDNVYQDHFHQDHVLGTSLDMLAISADQARTQRAFLAALAEINRLDHVLSTYRSDSEINTLNQAQYDGKPLIVSQDLFNVLQACESLHQQTCGAFSGRMGQLIKSHQNENSTEQNISKAQLAQEIQQAQVILDSRTLSVTRPQSVQFATDALAKGYIIDRAIDAARQAVPELSGLMVDIGGDIKVWGQAPRASGWKIGLRDAGQRADNSAPTQILKLKHTAAVAFSGQGARDVIRGTTTDSHLISPQSGQALNHVEHSIVVAPHATDADALATALTAMTPTEGMALIAQLEKTEAKVTLTNGDSYSSAGWHDLVATEQDYGSMHTIASSTTTTASSSTWPTGYNAVLDYDIPKPSSSNYHAPYVVIWVTDANRKLVRTLHIFGPQAKWMDSNYIWWKRYGRMMDHVDTIAQPSRAPGHYTVSWDGKDDAGQRVPQGKYTLHIEATREHGGHSYSTFDIDATPKSNTQNLPAKDELGDLKFRFDRAI